MTTSQLEIQASGTNFQPSNGGGRLRESIARRILPLGQSSPLPSVVMSHNQVSKTEFATGVNLENMFTRNVQQHGFHRDSGSLSSVLDLGADSPWNEKPYREIGFSSASDHSNQEAVRTLQDIRSSVDYNSFLGQSIASLYSTALPPDSGNFTAQGAPLMATSLGGGGSILKPTHKQKRSITRTKGSSIGSGLLPRNNLKARPSSSRSLTGVNGIKKIRKEGGRVSQLAKAFPLIGELKDVLKTYPSCAIAIGMLEESIGETIAQESRASQSSLLTHMHPLGIEPDNYLAVDSSTCDNSTSISATSDFSCLSQNDSSITFPSSDSIPNTDFMDITRDNETPRAIVSNTTIYHCTAPIEGNLCKFSVNSQGDWVRHEESDKHWPQKRYMCIKCIDLIEDEDGNSLCAFCFQRLHPVGSNKTHYLQCQKAQRGKHVFNAARKDHFRNHLKKHGMVNITSEALTWTFGVESDWHRQCGFCTQTFTTWDERKHHVAKHFQNGMDISSWRFPSSKKKRSNDYRPGIHYRRDDSGNDDDDDSENSRPKSHQTPSTWLSGQPFSGQADNLYMAEEWPDWMEGGTYSAQAGPTSMEKVEAYLKYQSQVESEADEWLLSDTKSRNSRGPEDYVGLSSSPQWSATMEDNLELAIKDILDIHRHWSANLYVKDKKTELEIVGRLHGKDYADTLASMSNLAVFHCQQDKYAKAESMYQQRLLLKEAVLGKDYPDTLASMNKYIGAKYSLEIATSPQEEPSRYHTSPISDESEVLENDSDIQVPMTPNDGWIASIAFLPDGKLVVSGSDHKALRLWDTVTGAAVRTLGRHLGSVTAAAFLQEGKMAMSGSEDKMVWLWSAMTRMALPTLESHSSSINSVAFSRHGKRAVFEHLKRLLYSVRFLSLALAKRSLIDQISIGELPINAAELEHQPTRIFKTPSHWNTILLLDEADVFLEQRLLDNLTRNNLVSVSLRQLEYYQAIMVFTRNRAFHLDEVMILSRIYLMPRYNELSTSMRRQFWENYLSGATASLREACVQTSWVSNQTG